MLNKTDLQHIQKIVKTEVQQETKKIVKDELKNLVTKDDLKKELYPIKKDVTQIRKDIKAIIAFFDHEYLELRKRVERIEDHLNLPPFTN